MPTNIKGEGKGAETKGLDIDLQEFELQIDKEIDSLFIPVGLSTGADNEVELASPDEASGVIELELEPDEEDEAPAPPPPPEAPARPVDEVKTTLAKKSLDLDIDAFEVQIDREIDALFVPVGLAAETPPLPAPEPLPKREAVTTPARPAAAPAPPVPKPVPEPEPRLEPLRLELELPEAEPVRAPAPPAPPARSERDVRLEEFNVAYLSLDWEFSPENVARMDAALANLEPFFRGSTASDSLHKLLKAVLHRLRTRPSSLNSQITEILRDAQGLVGPMTAPGSGPAPGDLQGLKSLIQRYQRMREQEAPASPPATPAAATEEESAPVGPRVEEPPAVVSFERPEAFEWETFREVRQWLGEEMNARADSLDALTEENRRLYQLEELLGRNPALNPLRVRLGGIRLAISQLLASMREKEGDWDVRMAWFESFEKRLEVLASAPPPVRGVAPVATEVETAAAVTRPEPPAPPERPVPETPPVSKAPPAPEVSQVPKMRRENVCVFHVGGKPLAVPGASVVKIEPVNAKKARKFLDRGFATLADFKSLFGSLKKGVLGDWMNRPAGELKAWRFRLAPLAGGSTAGAAGDGVLVLVSDGAAHGMILADATGVEFRPNVEFTPGAPDAEGILGTFPIPSGVTVSVIDPGKILGA